MVTLINALSKQFKLKMLHAMLSTSIELEVLEGLGNVV